MHCFAVVGCEVYGSRSRFTGWGWSFCMDNDSAPQSLSPLLYDDASEDLWARSFG